MKLFKFNINKKLSVEEATNKFYDEISKYLGWKFIKSQKCLKKTVGDLVFQINFYSSKWNESFKSIEIQCECQLWCKKFDKTLNVKSQVGYYSFKPNGKEWWNITDEKQLIIAIEQLCKQIDETIIPLSKNFENDFLKAVIELSDENVFNKYHIKLEFIDVYAGRDYILALAANYYDSLSDVMKQDTISYKQGARNKAWMINPSNLKYMIDNSLI